MTARTRVRPLLIFLALASGTATAELIATTPTPPAFAQCDAAFPATLVGTWRTDPDWTRVEYLRLHPDVDPKSLVSVGDSRITLTDKTFITDIPNIGQIERPYRIIGGNSRQYTLEFQDDYGETLVVQLVLQPCGLALETYGGYCTEAFCENVRDEVLQKVVDTSGGGITLEALRQSVDQTKTKLNGIVPRHFIYYRRVEEAD